MQNPASQAWFPEQGPASPHWHRPFTHALALRVSQGEHTPPIGPQAVTVRGLMQSPLRDEQQPASQETASQEH